MFCFFIKWTIILPFLSPVSLIWRDKFFLICLSFSMFLSLAPFCCCNVCPIFALTYHRQSGGPPQWTWIHWQNKHESSQIFRRNTVRCVHTLRSYPSACVTARSWNGLDCGKVAEEGFFMCPHWVLHTGCSTPDDPFSFVMAFQPDWEHATSQYRITSWTYSSEDTQ